MLSKLINWSNSYTFGIILRIVLIMDLLLLCIILLKSCYLCNYRSAIVDKTGYLPEKEDWSNIPDVVPPYDSNDTLNVSESVSLEHFFPPIGNQGDKGTCVAWAVGYNLKTALNAIENHWDSTMLSQASYQTSPKDLFLSIPKHLKGKGCAGTCFEPAFNALATIGAASMEDVPYQDLQGCSGAGKGDSTNCISKFYHVTDNGVLPRIGELKAFLADTIPLVISARLGDNFMNWHNADVIKKDTYNYTGMHAYHAMVLVGYDDNRQAFRLRNSWGKKWGDEGSIWVDYFFFCNEFCEEVLMAKN